MHKNDPFRNATKPSAEHIVADKEEPKTDEVKKTEE